MTDELYDYFGGNASKKVEPIEDDDLDLETEADSPDEVLNEVHDEESSVQSETQSETQLEAAKVEEEPEAETKKAGHWDFLANMLGISSPKPTVPRTKPAEEKPAEAKPAEPKTRSTVKDKPVVREAEVKATPVTNRADPHRDQNSPKGTGTKESSKADFLGFEAIPSPEDSTVLPTMFSAPKDELAAEATEATDDLIGWNPLPRKSFMVESSQSAEDSAEPDEEIPYEEDYEEVEALDGEEFVEFEIEELDVSPRDENEEAAHGRRRRKPSGRGDDSVDSGERQRSDRSSSSRSRSTRSRSSEGRSEIEPVQSERGPRREAGDRDEATTNESRSGRRPRRSRGGRGEKASREERPRHEARSEELEKNDGFDRDDLRDETNVFGAGLIDVDWEADLEDSNEPEVRGSGRTKAAPAEESRSEGTGSGRKRRRRRGSKSRKDRGAEESRAVESDSGFGAGIRDDVTDFDSGAGVDSFDDSLDVEDDLDAEEVGTDRDVVVDARPRKREGSRRPNRSTRTKARGDDDDDDDSDDGVDDLPEDDRQRAKVPTWDETITVLVESNIQNHKKNGGPRRSGGGGNRGRSGSGGSRDAGGSSSRGDRSGGSRGGGRSEGGDRGRR